MSRLELQKSPVKSLLLQVLFIVSLMMSTAACEEGVNPFIGTELPFTIWGMVNPEADTQAVRVFLIDDVLQLVSSDPLDATVSLIDVRNNNRYILQDSIIQLTNTDFRHIFWAPIEVEYFDQFRIEVERSDGQLSKSADVEVPGPISLHLKNANTNSITEVVQPVFIDGNPPSTPRIDVRYGAFTITPDGFRLADNPVTISYGTKTRVRQDTTWIDVDLRDDFKIIREDFDEKELEGAICVDDINIDVHVGNKEWQAPDGVFDPNFLVEPGTFSNIENGFGYFGAGFIETLNFNPSDLLLIRAGFVDCAAPISDG